MLVLCQQFLSCTSVFVFVMSIIMEVAATQPLPDERLMTSEADPLSQNRGALEPQGRELRGVSETSSPTKSSKYSRKSSPKSPAKTSSPAPTKLPAKISSQQFTAISPGQPFQATQVDQNSPKIQILNHNVDEQFNYADLFLNSDPKVTLDEWDTLLLQ